MSGNSRGSNAAQRFVDLFRAELSSIPIEHWGYFFPATVALWRIIEEIRRGVLGEVNAGYDEEPYFKGKGSEWFVSELLNAEEVMVVVDRLMRDTVARIPKELLASGSIRIGDVPSIEESDAERLVTVTLAFVDEAAAAGRINP